MEYKEQLEQLRQQIPIGIRHGLDLLQQTSGDMARARELFEAETIQLVVSKTPISLDLARKYLLACNYDLARTLADIDEARFSLPQRLLRKYKDNKEEALSQIVRQVVMNENIQSKYWLPLNELMHLSLPVFAVLAVNEFLSYEDWEGFSSAIYFHPDIITAQFQTILNMPEIVHCLQTAKQCSDIIYQQYSGQSPSSIANALDNDATFGACTTFFKKHRQMVIDRLYHFVVEQVDYFG